MLVPCKAVALFSYKFWVPQNWVNKLLDIHSEVAIEIDVCFLQICWLPNPQQIESINFIVRSHKLEGCSKFENWIEWKVSYKQEKPSRIAALNLREDSLTVKLRYWHTWCECVWLLWRLPAYTLAMHPHFQRSQGSRMQAVEPRFRGTPLWWCSSATGLAVAGYVSNCAHSTCAPFV